METGLTVPTSRPGPPATREEWMVELGQVRESLTESKQKLEALRSQQGDLPSAKRTKHYHSGTVRGLTDVIYNLGEVITDLERLRSPSANTTPANSPNRPKAGNAPPYKSIQ